MCLHQNPSDWPFVCNVLWHKLAYILTWIGKTLRIWHQWDILTRTRPLWLGFVNTPAPGLSGQSIQIMTEERLEIMHVFVFFKPRDFRYELGLKGVLSLPVPLCVYVCLAVLLLYTGSVVCLGRFNHRRPIQSSGKCSTNVTFCPHPLHFMFVVH